MDIKLFISAASVEFEDYRELLRKALTRANVSVKIQEDFKDNGETTLLKLDDYIKDCDAVIHLVGDACGGDAPRINIQALLKRHDDIASRFPGLARHVESDAAPLSYTQWEAWLALYHDKRLFIAKPEASAPRGPRHQRNPVDVERQRQHLALLAGQPRRHAGIEFRNLDNLIAQLLATPILDLMLSAKLAERLASDEATLEEFVKQEKRAGLPVPFFRYLWRELGSRTDLMGKLSIAARDKAVPDLVAKLSRRRHDAPEGDLLLDAWHRVEKVRDWEDDAVQLRLSLQRWQELAAIVATHDLRSPPPFCSLRELLLWALDLPEPGRGEAALTQLLWLGSESVRLDGGAGNASASRAVVKAIKADGQLQPYLARAQAGPGPSTGPVRLHVLLSLSEEQPQVEAYWVQTEPHSLVRGGELPPGTTFGEQLEAMAAALLGHGSRGVHVELIAPLVLLRGRPEWTSYGLDLAGFKGLEEAEVTQNFCDDWPVSWRWRERLEGQSAARPDHWRDWAAQVVAKAHQCAHLVCRFEHEAATDTPHLVALSYVPPGPKPTNQELKVFLGAMQAGHPYMLWPGDESAVDDFKSALRALRPRTADLPETLRLARSGKLKHAVLFIDDPTRNPFDLMGTLATSDSP